MKEVVAGMDLHSNNVVIGVMDLDGQRVATGKVPCDLAAVEPFLAPFKARLQQVAVESTYNWYWRVDGLQARQYPVVLANPAGMAQYSGIKHADATHDAFFLAELLRLKILPVGHIYDAQLRPVRDLLRRRMRLVQHRTALLLSFKSLHTRTTGQTLGLGAVKALAVKAAQALYAHPANQLIAGVQIQQLGQFCAAFRPAVPAVVCPQSWPNQQRDRDQSAGLQTGQGSLACDDRRGGLRPQPWVWTTRHPDESMNFEVPPSAS